MKTVFKALKKGALFSDSKPPIAGGSPQLEKTTKHKAEDKKTVDRTADEVEASTLYFHAAAKVFANKSDIKKKWKKLSFKEAQEKATNWTGWETE